LFFSLSFVIKDSVPRGFQEHKYIYSVGRGRHSADVVNGGSVAALLEGIHFVAFEANRDGLMDQIKGQDQAVIVGNSYQ